MHSDRQPADDAVAAIARRAQHLRELARLSNSLRPDLGLDAILTQLANAVRGVVGFKIAAFNLVQEGGDHVIVAAVAGLAAAEYQELVQAPPRLREVLLAMREEFRLSRSYFISHEHQHALDAVDSIVPVRAPVLGGAHTPGDWHPEDTLLVPLVSVRHDRLLGILSLDQPEDGKVPDLETMEIVELFANQAAVAIDLARLFEEREREQRAVQEGIYHLLGHIGLVGQGNLTESVDLGDTALGPVGDALNATVLRLRGVLADVLQASEAVSERAGDLRTMLRDLATGSQDQARQITQVVGAVGGMAQSVRHTAATADEVTHVALEASEIAHEGRDAAERAVLGMVRVRDHTLQSARKVKHLGEMTQQISEIARTVAQFADETNLLALNAAIEAARAGDHGRGFTLVVRQIRDLATNSSEAAQQIKARIKALQQETSAVAITIEECTREVVEQSDLAAQAGTALGAVDAVGKQIATGLGGIAQTAGQQAQSSTLVARTAEDIAHLTAQTQDAMERMRGAMERLAELARAVQHGIGAFRLARPLAPDAAARQVTPAAAHPQGMGGG
jgi:methyl-accepting chemotaxis protein